MSRADFPLGAAVTVSQLSADPHPVLARLRAEEPVSWIAVFDGWLVTRRDLCVTVMRDAETYTVDDPRFSTGRVIGPSMLSLDGAEHRRHRGPFVDPFRRAEVRARFDSFVRERAVALVRSLAASGSAELRADLAAPLAAQVMTFALDLEGVDEARLLEWYDAIVAAVDAVTVGEDLPQSGVQAFAALHAAVESNMGDSSLLAAVAGGGSLTTTEVVSNVAVLLFGGIVTVESSVATLFSYLLAQPGLLHRVRADRGLVSAAVEEALRLEPAAAAVDRYAATDASLGGVSIRRGDLVRVSLTAAGRDPAVFADPDRFDLDRRNGSQHLAFAVGPHACLGIHLARLEAAAALDAALSFLPGLRAEPGSPTAAEGLIFRAPAGVPARWDAPGR